MLLGGGGHAGSFLLRVLKSGGVGEVLGEGLSRVFISSVLERLKEVYSLSFVRAWPGLANGTTWISATFLPEEGQ